MLLSLVVFALLTVGFCVPCLLDIARTPRYEIRSLTKGSWLVLVIVFWVFGGIAWLMLGRPGGRLALIRRDAAWQARPGPAAALRRHPAGRATDLSYGLDPDAAAGAWPWAARPVGPDDDAEFLLALERQIREAGDDYGW
jgi:hypothetical protein